MPLILHTLLNTQNIPKGIIIKTKNINTVNNEWNSGGIKLIKKRMVEEGIDCFNRKDSYARNDKICLLFENINDNAIEYNTLKIVNFKIYLDNICKYLESNEMNSHKNIAINPTSKLKWSNSKDIKCCPTKNIFKYKYQTINIKMDLWYFLLNSINNEIIDPIIDMRYKQDSPEMPNISFKKGIIDGKNDFENMLFLSPFVTFLYRSSKWSTERIPCLLHKSSIWEYILMKFIKKTKDIALIVIEREYSSVFIEDILKFFQIDKNLLTLINIYLNCSN